MLRIVSTEHSTVFRCLCPYMQRYAQRSDVGIIFRAKTHTNYLKDNQIHLRYLPKNSRNQVFR